MNIKALEQQNNVFIDPVNCGSSVGYYMTLAEHTSHKGEARYSLDATVVLADCSHKIDWDFSGIIGDNSNVEKVDVAIRMLQEFRTKLIAADKHFQKLNQSNAKK